jgi:tetratricopeptide (TPR) repeat protein
LIYLPAAGLTVGILTVVFFTISLWRNKNRLNLLNEVCDPDAFLKRTEKQAEIIEKNPRLAAFIAIDRSAGLICRGEYQAAKELLEEMDKEKISKLRSVLLAYTINLTICYYELGDIQQAERLFETQIAVLPPINKRQQQLVKILIGGRYFYLGKYEESYEYFTKLLEDKYDYSKREYLTILFFLAQIEEIKGNFEAAKVKYQRIVAKGNKLWIAVQASENARTC